MTDDEFRERLARSDDVRERLARLDAMLSPVTVNDHILAELRSLRALMDERDRLYNSQFKAAEIAVTAALAAQEKAVSAAFLASEKAIIKAEEAQKDYNQRSNEFRGQLDDQAKMLMPRNETLTMFKAMEDKVGGMAKTADDRAAAVQVQITDLQVGKAEQRSFNDRTTLMQNQINDLNISKAELQGKATQGSVMNAQIFAVIGISVAVIGLILTISVRFF